MNRFLSLLRLSIIPFLTVALVVGIYLLPRKGTAYECSINMDLPTGMKPNGWYGKQRQESPEERSILAEDTTFSKADYVQEMPITLSDNIEQPVICRVSIVRSGHDLNNSIHRPERCLPAQGHFNLVGSVVGVPIQDHGTIKMTKLKSQQNVSPDSTTPVIMDSMHYYVFLGHGHMTENHLMRTFIDMKDRVLLGRDQHWAYFQISTPYGPQTGVSEEKAKEKTEQLISQLLSRLVRWDELR